MTVGCLFIRSHSAGPSQFPNPNPSLPCSCDYPDVDAIIIGHF